ncbi:MAG: hypothetical protein LBN40_02590 [Oscillospiraceae bacterium]|jgi:stage III sporulation protein AG|nr:hypothetical protein [Oscillospiraceae bacterium]
MADNKTTKDRLKEFVKSDKAITAMLIVGGALMLLIFVSDFGGIGDVFAEKQTVPELSAYADSLEAELEELLPLISGVGHVRVMVTLSGGETPPVVRGVAVICDGGGNVTVRQRVIETVSKALGISSARVSVVN